MASCASRRPRMMKSHGERPSLTGDPMSSTFHIIDPAQPRGTGRESFEAQKVPRALGSHREAARFFQPEADLVLAVNAALAVGAPLLLTGEPGTGKTQVAYWLADHLGIMDR